MLQLVSKSASRSHCWKSTCVLSAANHLLPQSVSLSLSAVGWHGGHASALTFYTQTKATALRASAYNHRFRHHHWHQTFSWILCHVQVLYVSVHVGLVHESHVGIDIYLRFWSCFGIMKECKWTRRCHVCQNARLPILLLVGAICMTIYMYIRYQTVGHVSHSGKHVDVPVV